MALYKQGDLIGDYVLIQALDEGGQGYVWRARHATDGTTVALKLLTKPGSSEDTVQLRQEIELSAAMAANRSSYFVRVLGGSIDPVPHIVMEFIDGTDLREELARVQEIEGPNAGLPQEEIIRIGTTIANALNILHAEGIIHRDIKPDNVMVDRRGNIKLTDFGIAKIIGYHSISIYGDHPMSLSYAAPEVWAGKPVLASDIYAMGVTLFELLAGRPPFTGNPPTLYAKHNSETANFATLPTETVELLQELLKSCLNKNPAERPDSKRCLELLAEASQALTASAEEPAHLPHRFGSWLILEPNASQDWSWVCIHRDSGTRAVVEIFFAADLAEMQGAIADARKALRANAGLVQFGAEQLYDVDRVLLAVDESWVKPAPGPFSYLIATAPGEAAPPPAALSRPALQTCVASLLGLIAAADESGVKLNLAPSELSVAQNGSVQLRHPGLFSSGAAPASQAGLAFLRGLPTDPAAHAATLAAADLAGLAVALGRLPEPVEAEQSNETQAYSGPTILVDPWARPQTSPDPVVVDRPTAQMPRPEDVLPQPSPPSDSDFDMQLRAVGKNALTGKARYELFVRNQALRNVVFSLGAASSDGLQIAIPPTLALKGGETVLVPVTVTTPKRRFWGNKVTRSFDVEASNGGPPRRITTTLSDGPAPWLPVAGGLAAAGIAALAIIAFAAGGGDDKNKTEPLPVLGAQDKKDALAADVPATATPPPPTATLVPPTPTPVPPPPPTPTEEPPPPPPPPAPPAGQPPVAPVRTSTPVPRAAAPPPPPAPPPAVPPTSAPPNMPTFQLIGASISGEPRDVVPPGGTLNSCTARSIYFHWRWDNVQALPTTTFRKYYRNGTLITSGQGSDQLTTVNGSAIRGVVRAETAAPFEAGTYRFELEVLNRGQVLAGNFTLVC